VLLAGTIAVITANHVATHAAAYERQAARDSYCKASGMVPSGLRCILVDNAGSMRPAILAAVAKQESGFRVDVCSRAGACGLFQFMPQTAAAYAVDRTSPESSTRGAAFYLSKLQARFGNIGLALAAYNWGQGNLAKWRSTKGAKTSTIPAETRSYVLAITGHPIEAFLGKNPPSAFGGHIASLEPEMMKPGAR
jgi:soluble lytic murein transglycosylase-like protein